MKKLHAILLSVLAGALTTLAQDSSPPQPADPPPAPTEPAVPVPDTPPAAEPAAPAPAPAVPAVTPALKTPTPARPPAPAQPAATPVSAPAEANPMPANLAPTPAPAEPGADAKPLATQEPAASGTTLTVRAAEAAAPITGGEESTTNAAPGEVVPLIVIDDVPLTDAIRNLARQSDLNFMFDPQITATNQPNISIRFENVTAEEALMAVLENYNLAIARQPRSKIARISIKDPRAEDPLVVKIIQLKYCDPTNLVEVVRPTLSSRSRVLADVRTRQLIVNTTEREVDNLMQLIDKLDSRTKQVLIEARIFETMKNPRTIKGINWEGTLGAQQVTMGNNSTFQEGLGPRAPTPATITTLPDGTSQAVGGDPGFAGVYNGMLGSTPRVLASAAKGPFFNPAFAFMNADGVSAVVSFLNKDTDTELLATPRAVTLDNQEADLSVTRAYPVFQVTPGSANSPAGATITYTNLGTILKVTPRIAADNNVSLTVIPEVSNIDGKDEQTLNGQKNIANIYSFRRINTRVMIPSGFTLVMGGLIDDRSTKIYTKVPILGDLPVLGFFFRHSDKGREKKNMVFFITPTIVQDGDFRVATSGTQFLQTEFVDRPEIEENAWDSAKPHDWTKPVE